MFGTWMARVVSTATMVVAGATLAAAQGEGTSTGYLNPFPAGDVHKVLVVGDDLAAGLLNGLVDGMGADTRLDIVKRHHLVNGLVRNDFDDRLTGLNDLLAREPISVALIMLGAWDRNSMRLANGKRAAVGSVEWRSEYGARADRLMKTLKKRSVGIYWVGLPNVRRPEADEDAKLMNEIIRERAYVNGVKYIDSYAGFVDEQGGFSAYGPDQTGKMVLLREGDGVYFTAAGNRKLAYFVERELKRDLTQAKAERSVPLAGSEPEQARINPAASAANAAAGAAAARPSAEAAADPKAAGALAGNVAPGSSTASAPTSTEASGATAVRRTPVAAAEPPPATEQKSDNGKISLKLVSQSGREEVVALDIVRPAIPASVVALVTRRESVDKPTQMGEQLVDQIAGGLTVMSSVTPSSTATSVGGGGRRLSPTQSPYYRVLLKGERLPAKRGRADDFSWPRPEGPVTRSSSPAPPRPAPGARDTGSQTVSP